MESHPEEIIFTGEVEHSLDAQRRISIPSEWRTKEGSNRFVMLPAKGSTLQLVPFQTFKEEILSKAKKASLANANDMRDLALLGSQAQSCECDKQGRIQIPQKLLAHAKIKDKAVLVGAISQIQVWAPELWSATQGAGEGFFDVMQRLSETPDSLANIVRGALGGSK